MSYPRNIELTSNPPNEIHTIIDFDRKLVSSTQDVWIWISPDELTKMAVKMGVRNEEKGSEESNGN